jgi:hypothetical protein
MVDALIAYKPVDIIRLKSLGGNANFEDAYRLVESKPELKSLEFKCHNLDNHEIDGSADNDERQIASRFCDALQNHVKLKVLSLHVQQVSKNLGAGLAAALGPGTHSTLRSLSIHTACLTPNGTVTLLEALSLNKTLKFLKIDVGPRGMRALGNLLRVNKSLNELILTLTDASLYPDEEEFDLDDTSADARELIRSANLNILFDALRKNTTLRRLTAKEFYTRNSTISWLVTLLRANSTLETIDLKMTKISESVAVEGLRRIVDVFVKDQNKTLKRFLWPRLEYDRDKHAQFVKMAHHLF